MATQVFTIPARNDFPAYEFKIDLDGVVYTLFFRYNTRMTRWLLDIMDASGNPILMGLPLLITVDTTGRFVNEGVPAGFIDVSDDSNQGTQPTRDSFGTDHSLLYVTDG